MSTKLKNLGLVGLGVVAGVAVSLQFSALAHRPVGPGIPMEQLHELARVYGLIKSDYVESVDVPGMRASWSARPRLRRSTWPATWAPTAYCFPTLSSLQWVLALTSGRRISPL